MKLIPDERLSPETSNIAVSDSGLTLRENDSKYWLEFSFDGQRYFSEAKYLLLNLAELEDTLKRPVSVYRVTGRDQYEVVDDYDLTDETRRLLAAGWRHAVASSSRSFLKCIGQVSLVACTGLSVAAFESNMSPALPCAFLLMGAASAFWTYLSTRWELPKGAEIAAAAQKRPSGVADSVRG